MSTSRIPSTSAPARQIFGLFAIIESKRVVLPLKGVECDFSVASGIAEVSMTQIFRQENAKPLDCEYLFPLPADASVYFCEAEINGRKIRAQVRERQEARQLAAEKKAAGHRTALVESERDNLFTLSLGNVQPDDLVVIELKYFQTLRSLAGKPSLEIPFCPGMRYIPGKPLLRSNRGKGIVDDTDQVPDASRISPVRIDGEHPDAAYVEVRGTLDGKFVNEQDLNSPSHPITVQRAGDELRVTLANKGDAPDRDFVLRWAEKNVQEVASRAWLRERGTEVYALVEVRAPKSAQSEREPMDFYFLVDRSGSMAGEKWTKAAEALQSCVQVLGAADRVMVTLFESGHEDFAEGPMDKNELLADERFGSIAELGVGGGTEMRPALSHVLKVAARHSRGRPKNIILITDAQIGNDASILELMQEAPDFPVHCFGIDVALNDELLLGLCRQQGGTYHSMNPRDDIGRAVTALGKTLGQPVLLDLQLPEGWEAADSRIPNLYAGQIHYLSARSTAGKPLELSARTAGAQPVKIQFERHDAPGEAPYLHWCRSRMGRLIGEGKAKEAIKLSVQSNLICRLTAFVAWDESEKVAVATHDLVQPVMAVPCPPSFASLGAIREPHPGAAILCDGPRYSFSSSAAKIDGMELLGKTTTSDMRELMREFSDICQQAGITDCKEWAKTIRKWILQARGKERAQRIALVEELLRNLKLLVAPHLPNMQPSIEEIRKRVDAMIKTAIEAQNIWE
jgi:Ca-activated chloride channel family protein